jgi:peptidoglycan hydrolase-like protein with peptidoglycan-binding domain
MPCGKWRFVAELAGTLLVCSALFAQTDSTSSKAAASKAKTTHTSSKSAAKPTSKTTSASHTTHSTKSKSAKTRTAGSTSSRRGKKSKKTAKKGQQKIESERAQQIQQALIKEHYLSGEPTGKWDPATEDALRKFQADNGWQNKTVPDSRALIKLGLGPSHDHLLNPESAMTTVPDAPSAQARSGNGSAHAGPAPQSQPQQ